MKTTVFAAILGGGITYVGLRTMSLNDLGYALAFAAAGAFVAGWIAGRRGLLMGIAAMLAAASIWSADVLIRSWSDGQLALQSPNCDPCGLAGHAGRLLIVAAIGAPYFAPVGAVGGWVGAAARGRFARA